MAAHALLLGPVDAPLVFDVAHPAPQGLTELVGGLSSGRPEDLLLTGLDGVGQFVRDDGVHRVEVLTADPTGLEARRGRPVPGRELCPALLAPGGRRGLTGPPPHLHLVGGVAPAARFGLPTTQLRPARRHRRIDDPLGAGSFLQGDEQVLPAGFGDPPGIAAL